MFSGKPYGGIEMCIRDRSMGGLMAPVTADWRYLLGAGVIMVLALMFSKIIHHFPGYNPQHNKFVRTKYKLLIVIYLLFTETSLNLSLIHI